MVAGGRELIDTLWNVNFLGLAYGFGGLQELIDTLWNVNCSVWVFNLSNSIRINRYIMECK